MSELILVSQLPIDQNPAAVYLGSLSESGRRTMHQSLDVIAGMLTGNADAFSCNWAALRFQHTSAIRSKLSESYKPATVNKMLSALRSTMKAAWKLGQISGEDYHMAVSVECVQGNTIPAGRDLSLGEIKDLMETCKNDPTPAGARDGAIIAVMYACGLRRQEVVDLNLEDYDPIDGRVVVTGKGNKERSTFILNGASRAVADWLDVRGDFPGSLFVPIIKGGTINPRQMTTQAIYNMLRKRAKQAGVERFSPHDLRRSFVGAMLDAGNDLSVVQQMAGHASPTTTARYDRRPESAKRQAADRMYFPYSGR